MSSALIIAGALLFSIAHPGLINSRGLSFFGLIALVPVFWCAQKKSYKTVWLSGLGYGALSYGLFCYWMARYEVIAFVALCLWYGLLMAVVFILLHAVFEWCKGWTAYVGAAILWVVFEYCKTKGFLGFSYGVLGYSLWRLPLLVRNAAWGGVWPLSLFCALCSAAVTSLIKVNKNLFIKQIPLYAVLAVYALVLVLYPVCSKRTESRNGAVRNTVPIISVQHDTDPWKGGVEAYRKDVKVLMQLTDDALAAHPDTQLVVWPETAVVPPIVWNYQEKKDFDRYQLVLELLSYIQRKNVLFVIGNQHSVDAGKKYTDDYNGVLVFDAALNNVIPPDPQLYCKNHLVPFTETFPYQKLFPHLYQRLLKGDTHLWTAGTERTVFTGRGIPFATPICFEDTFGSECRLFCTDDRPVRAALFITVSNDAWSQSDACQYQHLSMAVFRSAENRIPTVRSTASGISCLIDQYGAVVLQAPSFARTALYGTVSFEQNAPVTLYTKWGDWFVTVLCVLLIVLVMQGIGCKVVERKHTNEVQ